MLLRIRGSGRPHNVGILLEGDADREQEGEGVHVPQMTYVTGSGEPGVIPGW
jgi:hypothetical protein